MQAFNRTTASAPPPYPEAILQFGGGNFLRAFTGWIVDVCNEKQGARLGVLVATTTARQHYGEWNDQEGLYHLHTKGIRDGKTVDETRLITCVSRIIAMGPQWEAFLATATNPATKYVISNTTEAGIRFGESDRKADDPPATFPAKLTHWLYRRWLHFSGAKRAGLTFFPTELIVDNGECLRECILQYSRHWELEGAFADWVRDHNRFCNTLVDRIVPGIPREELPGVQEELGYKDVAVTSAEPYHLWAIQAPESVREELPLDELGLNIVFTDDLAPYRESKVRILNGAHSSMVPVGLLAGLETVGDALQDAAVGSYLRKLVLDEIVPSLDLPAIDLEGYAESIMDRFRNPFIDHRLIDISLNATSKMRVRVLPSVLAFHGRFHRLPPRLVTAFASFVRLYRPEENFTLTDDAAALGYMRDAWATSSGDLERVVNKVLSWEENWRQDLREVPGLTAALKDALTKMEREGFRSALER